MTFDTRIPLAGLVAASLALALAPSAAQTPAATSQRATAIFAGGCFWCMEPPFDALPGVFATTSGYIGGRTKNPTYEQVSSGGTGHIEALEVTYDPGAITYEQLLAVYWRNVDAVDGGGQFCDRGSQYRPAIFYQSEEQRRLAEASLQEVAARLGAKVATEIISAGPFYRAEEYHQDYYKKNPVRYKFYKWNCGRDQRLEQLWGKPGSR